jgi:hypothetical protein
LISKDSRSNRSDPVPFVMSRSAIDIIIIISIHVTYFSLNKSQVNTVHLYKLIVLEEMIADIVRKQCCLLSSVCVFLFNCLYYVVNHVYFMNNVFLHTKLLKHGKMMRE